MILSGLGVPDPDGALVQQREIAGIRGALTKLGDYQVHVGLTHVLPTGRTPELRHEVPEVVVVIGGSLRMMLDGEITHIQAGDHFIIPARTWHLFENQDTSEATMLYAFGGDPSLVTVRRESMS